MKKYRCENCGLEIIPDKVKYCVVEDSAVPRCLVEVGSCPSCGSEDIEEIEVEPEIKCPVCGGQVYVTSVILCDAAAYLGTGRQVEVVDWDVSTIHRRDYAEAFCTNDPEHELGDVREAIAQEGMLE